MNNVIVWEGTEKEYDCENVGIMDSNSSKSFNMDIGKFFDALVRIFEARGIELKITYNRKDRKECDKTETPSN